MKQVTVKINRRNLTGLLKKESFNTSGMFVPYQFIAVDFDIDKKNTARFYSSCQPSSNSWTNYPGIKLWSSISDKNKKDDILEYIEAHIEDAISATQEFNENVKFELIGF